jgi:hypothetical protein
VKFLIDAFYAGFKTAANAVGAPSIAKIPSAPAAPAAQTPVLANQTAAVAPKPLPKTSVPTLPTLSSSGKQTVGGTSSAQRDSGMGGSVTQPPSPPAAVSQLHQTNASVTNMAKQSDINYDQPIQGGMMAPVRIGQQRPSADNGDIMLGAPPPEINDGASPDNVNRTINNGFNNLNTPKNQDVVNESGRLGGTFI